MKLSKHLSQRIFEYQNQLLECCEVIQTNELNIGYFNISVITILLTFTTSFSDVVLSSLVAIAGPSTRRPFSNQISIKLETQDGKCCCKFFRNGKVHVTGTKSIARAMTTVDAILREVGQFSMTLGNFDVEMLNTNFRLATPLFLTKLCELAEVDKAIQVSYDSSRYPGVKLRLRGHGVMLIFSSGSVIFTGCRGPNDLAKMFSVLSGILLANPVICTAKRAHKVKKDTIKKYVCGYPSGLVDGIVGFRL